MIDHLVVAVRDLPRSTAFYERCLRPLGHTNRVTYDGHANHAALAGFGDANESYLLLRAGVPRPQAVHLAFAAPSRRAVRAFYSAALKAGGRDNGPPGERLQYFAGYYAAYVLDPDGYNVEAVYQQR